METFQNIFHLCPSPSSLRLQSQVLFAIKRPVWISLVSLLGPTFIQVSDIIVMSFVKLSIFGTSFEVNRISPFLLHRLSQLLDILQVTTRYVDLQPVGMGKHPQLIDRRGLITDLQEHLALYGVCQCSIRLYPCPRSHEHSCSVLVLQRTNLQVLLLPSRRS